MKNMKQSLILLLTASVGIASFLTGCASSYTPNAVSVPLLNNKYEYQGSIRAGVNGIDLQNTFAVTDQIAVMVNGSYSNDHSSTEKDFHKHRFGELAIGYYKSIESEYFFECFAGFGSGKTDILDQDGISKSIIIDEHSAYKRFFIQPNYGYRSGPYEWGLGIRAVYINFNKFKTTDDELEGTRKKSFFIEPAFIFKYDMKYAKLTGQTGLNIPVVRRERMIFSTDVILFNFGIEIPLNRKVQ